MHNFRDLMAAAADSFVNSAQAVRQACQRGPPPPVGPTLVIAAPKIVLVKKAYQAEGHRLRITVGVDARFTGTGTLSCNEAAAVNVFDDQGRAVALPLALTALQLNRGRVLLVEGAAPSAGLNTTTFTLTLTAGAEPLQYNPANDSLTSVEVQLDLCQYKAVPGGADPGALSDAAKQNPGRNLHLHDARHLAGRALLIVHKARPHAYAGSVVLTTPNGRVAIYDGADEVPTNGQVALPLPNSTLNANVPGTGLRLWVQGEAASAAMRDASFVLGISDLPQREGDRVNLTVVQAVLEMFKSPIKPTAPPALIDDAQKMNPGRFVHLQDAGNHHARAKIGIRHTLPRDFNGALELLSCDTAGTAGAALALFDEQAPGTGAQRAGNPYIVNHNGTAFATPGEDSWVQGAAVSAALRDAELRLRVTDAEGAADRGAFTVANLTQIQATIQSTPANNQTNSAAMTPPVAAPVDHVFTSTHYDPAFPANDLLVLMRIDTAPAVRLVVTAAPAALPLLWQAVRNPQDHPSLGNAAAVPTVTPGAPVTQGDLLTDNKGSFHVHAYIDCNGSNTYSSGEPSIPLSLVLVDARIFRDSSAARTANLQVDTVNNRIVNGQWGNTPLTAPDLAGAGMAMELSADVTGGGADGRLGLNKVFAGLINNVRTRAINFAYTDTSVRPATTHRERLIATSNPTVATGGGGAWYTTGDPVPLLYALPLLDSGAFANPGLGADTACMSTSVKSPEVRSNRTRGQRWVIRCIDSPGTPFRRTHFVNVNAVLSDVDYQYDFRAAFCFWTNLGAVRGSSGAVAERRYAVLRNYDWGVRGVWTVVWPLAGPAAFTVVTPHTIRSSGATTHAPLERPSVCSLEVRPPSGIAAGLKWDAQ